MDISSKITILNIKGALTSENAAEFESHVKSLLEQDRFYFILNGENLEFLSSEGIGAIIYVHRLLKERNGIFVMSNLNTEVYYLLKILGLNDEITFTDTIENGVKEITLITNRKLDVKDTDLDFQKGIKHQSNNTIDYASKKEKTPEEKSPVEEKPADKPEKEKENSGRIMDISRTEEKSTTVDIINSEGALFPEPLVIECGVCKAYSRVYRSGTYMCPACNTEFEVKDDGTAIF